MATSQTTALDARAVDRALKRMADEIVELNSGTDDLVIVGIQRRGVQLAERIVRVINDREGTQVPRGALDITLYRDDLQTVGPRPVAGTGGAEFLISSSSDLVGFPKDRWPSG